MLLRTCLTTTCRWLVSMDESVKSPYPTGGAGMNVFGPTTKKARGRKSQAENILAQVVAQNASIHIKARTNEALQTLHNLVKENPNPKGVENP